MQKQQTMSLRLCDANDEEVATTTVTTDEYGMAAADFILPQVGKTGTYTLYSDYGDKGYCNFIVEEYKRPTFSVEIQQPTVRYAAGDTVRLAATAKSFAGVPMQGAKVRVEGKRLSSHIWRCRAYADTPNDYEATTVYTDTLQTAGDGAFTVNVPITMPEQYDESVRRYFNFLVTAYVTDVSGETQRAEPLLP